MTTSSTWDYKVIGLAALSLLLAIVVAVQGVVLYEVIRHEDRWQQHQVTVDSSISKAPLAKSDQARQPDAWAHASTNPWNAMTSPGDDLRQQLAQFNARMDQLFADTLAQNPVAGFGFIDNDPAFTVPNMDLRDDKDHYTVRMDMPGADKDTIKVNVEGQLLTVSGQHHSDNETKDDGNKLIRSERSTSQFERTITLPSPVKTDEVKADYTNGVLTIELPKDVKTPDSTSVTVH